MAIISYRRRQMNDKVKSDKKISDASDVNIRDAVKKESKDGKLACAQAFAVVHRMKVTPAAVGECADELKIRLIRCQLGLFGYYPEKRIVKPATDVAAELRDAIIGALYDGRLPCASAWKIAEKFHTGKMDVSSACEKMAIKIKPCQLGAF